jgi:PLAT/LH2 domain
MKKQLSTIEIFSHITILTLIFSMVISTKYANAQVGVAVVKTINPKAVNLIPVPIPAFEDINIYRIQLRITTGVGDDAGTDQGVYVQFNDDDQKFFLSKGIDNFEEGHTDTYDVLTEAVRKIKDIKYLKFGLKGDDGICFKKIQLYINDNDVPVFVKEYPGRGNCIDNNGSFIIPEEELRGFFDWKYTVAHKDMWRAPEVISKDMIKSLVECAIGNQMNYTTAGFAWGTASGIPTLWGDAVEVNKVNNNTLHFDLDLQRALVGPNPEVDVDFDVVFNCNNGVIETRIDNLKTSTNLVGDLQSLFREKMAEFIGKAIAKKIGHNVGPVVEGLLSKYLEFGINFNVQNPNLPASCLNIHISNNGDIHLH